MLDHFHSLSPLQAIKRQGNTLFVNDFGLFVLWKNMFTHWLEQPNSRRLQTADKAACPFIAYIKYKRLPLHSFMQISTCTYTYTNLYVHRHRFTASRSGIASSKLQWGKRILKNDIFSYKKWPHYTVAVITNDNILLSISIALSIHHGPMFWQQLSVHPFLDGICRCSKTTVPLILNTLSIVWSLQACGSGHH